ncbi:hypothetical protein ACM642_10355 [Chryseobacterium sp. CY353]|nr:hypothetical protein [Chryseobacterium sp. CY353]
MIVLFAVSAAAQTHRFIYDVVYKPDSTSSEVRKTNYHLDINPDRPSIMKGRFSKAILFIKQRDYVLLVGGQVI